MRKLKIGDKVRHCENNLEGYVAYSTFGLSVNGFIYEDNSLIHVKTLGMPEHELREMFKRVYKFKYDMLRYEEEKITGGINNV